MASGRGSLLRADDDQARLSVRDAFFQEIPIPTRLWEWSTASALVWCPVAFVLGFHRFLDWRRPRFERGLVLVAAVASGALLVVPHLYFFTAMLVTVGVALGMAVYVNRPGRSISPLPYSWEAGPATRRTGAQARTITGFSGCGR
jgi:hypothetical protein